MLGTDCLYPPQIFWSSRNITSSWSALQLQEQRMPPGLLKTLF